ncbi:MAG: hypothetical protein J3Q66DRAFT_157160 [Benniella sp.]|nr:MAG: hypothetical protein J3Q66DRAFT_157160 [Benniella sp.]
MRFLLAVVHPSAHRALAVPISLPGRNQFDCYAGTEGIHTALGLHLLLNSSWTSGEASRVSPAAYQRYLLAKHYHEQPLNPFWFDRRCTNTDSRRGGYNSYSGSRVAHSPGTSCTMA